MAAQSQSFETQLQARDAQLQARDAKIASLTRQLGERPDDSFWRGQVESGERRCHEMTEELRRTSSELGQAQLKYYQLKERVRQKTDQVGQRASGSAQPSVGIPRQSSLFSLDTIERVEPLGSGAMPQRSAAPEGSFTSRPPRSSQRRRLEDPPEPRPEEGEGSRQE